MKWRGKDHSTRLWLERRIRSLSVALTVHVKDMWDLLPCFLLLISEKKYRTIFIGLNVHTCKHNGFKISQCHHTIYLKYWWQSQHGCTPNQYPHTKWMQCFHTSSSLFYDSIIQKSYNRSSIPVLLHVAHTQMLDIFISNHHSPI